MNTQNYSMQPSGEVGRFEVDDHSSPPADRWRYLPAAEVTP